MRRNRAIFAIAIANFQRRPEIVAISGNCGAGVRPRPRRGPGNHPCEFRCSVSVCDAALLACDIVWYGVNSVLSVSLSRFVSAKRVGEVSEHTLSESKVPCSSSFFILAFWGRFPWWGDACVSRYHGPLRRLSERRGGPWAPPPLVLLILLAVSCPGRY